MSRDEQAERRHYDESRRRECDEVDPWFGHTATDVTYALHPPIPKHSSHPRLEYAPEPCYNRTATDVTAPFESHPNSPGPDYYYGRQDTDVTAHLQVPVPKFVKPQGCSSHNFAGKRYDQAELHTPDEAHSHNQRAFDYMHPLGTHRPFPLSNYYYHSGSKPSTPCGSRSQSPHRHPQSRSPSPERERRSKSPRSRSRSPGRIRPQSRSPSPEKRSGSPSRSPTRRKRTGPRSRSPSPAREEVRARSRYPSPYPSDGHFQPEYNIPQKYLQCRNRCHLSPPCPECDMLLDEERRQGKYEGNQAGMRYDRSPPR